METNSVSKSLTVEFQAVKEKISTMAALSASTRDLLHKILNDCDEGLLMLTKIPE
jgi:hypothetical protein